MQVFASLSQPYGGPATRLTSDSYCPAPVSWASRKVGLHCWFSSVALKRRTAGVMCGIALLGAGTTWPFSLCQYAP